MVVPGVASSFMAGDGGVARDRSEPFGSDFYLWRRTSFLGAVGRPTDRSHHVAELAGGVRNDDASHVTIGSVAARGWLGLECRSTPESS